MKYLAMLLLAVTVCSCASGVRWDTEGDASLYTKVAHLTPDQPEQKQ